MRIEGDKLSNETITVAPVVVQPDTDSKNALDKDIDKSLSKMNGNDPKKLKDTQNMTTIKNPSFVLISEISVSLRLGKYIIEPKKRIIRNE
tara:strand:+ start:1068 stop:1340 length:273 start_codon:yes stop_codon:yes gene_type:complete